MGHRVCWKCSKMHVYTPLSYALSLKAKIKGFSTDVSSKIGWHFYDGMEWNASLTAKPKHRLGCALFLLKNRFLTLVLPNLNRSGWRLPVPPIRCALQIVFMITIMIIKFCTHLLLYGIHLWVDLDCDRHVGGSRPNQNEYVFCITCNAPYRRRFRRQTVRVEVRTGAIVKNSRILQRGRSQIQNSIFRIFRVLFDYPAHKETVLPQTNGTDGKPRLWSLVWRVCDQAFGRYRPVNGAEKW